MKVLMCQRCYAINPQWNYANANNSSKFCSICGTYVGEYNFTEREIINQKEKHVKWLFENGKITDQEKRIEYRKLDRELEGATK